MPFSDKTFEGAWKTISLETDDSGLAARERYERFRLEAMSEVVLRLAGGLMVAGSMLLWLVLPANIAPGNTVSNGMLAAMFSAVGLFVFAYGTRGFRRQLALDADNATLTLTKININEQGRVQRSIDIDDIESLYLLRSKARGNYAGLYVRVRGTSAPLLALTGAREELELIHHDLFEILHGTGSDVTPLSAESQSRFARHLAPAQT